MLLSRPIYRTCAADPAWPYNDKLAMSDVKRSADAHYQTMSIEDICALGDPKGRTIAGFRMATTSFLWLWITNPFLLDGTGARVCRAWGYEPRQLVTWVKGRIVAERFIAQIGMGHFTRGATEHLILATRGPGPKSLVLAKNVPNVLIAPRRRHSEKPDAAYGLIERVTPGPFVELFARRERPNWTVWGNEVKAA